MLGIKFEGAIEARIRETAALLGLNGASWVRMIVAQALKMDASPTAHAKPPTAISRSKRRDLAAEFNGLVTSFEEGYVNLPAEPAARARCIEIIEALRYVPGVRKGEEAEKVFWAGATMPAFLRAPAAPQAQQPTTLPPPNDDAGDDPEWFAALSMHDKLTLNAWRRNLKREGYENINEDRREGLHELAHRLGLDPRTLRPLGG